MGNIEIKNHKGFTVFELMIVIALILLFSLVSLPFGIDFYREITADHVSNSIFESLRNAQNSAITSKNDSSWGVKILENRLVLFQGNSYQERIDDYDKFYNFPLGTEVSGLDEIIFEKITGKTNEYSVLISYGDKSREIEINSQGIMKRK